MALLQVVHHAGATSGLVKACCLCPPLQGSCRLRMPATAQPCPPQPAPHLWHVHAQQRHTLPRQLGPPAAATNSLQTAEKRCIERFRATTTIMVVMSRVMAASGLGYRRCCRRCCSCQGRSPDNLQEQPSTEANSLQFCASGVAPQQLALRKARPWPLASSFGAGLLVGR